MPEEHAGTLEVAKRDGQVDRGPAAGVLLLQVMLRETKDTGSR